MIPRSTSAAVLREYSKPLTVEEVPLPELVPGALVIEVDASTICGADSHMRTGVLARRDDMPGSVLPIVLGHEYTGTIVAAQDRPVDATGQPLALGDRIVFAYPRCGRCYWCVIAGQPTLCMENRPYGWGPCDEWPYATGGFAQHMFVRPECHVIKVPPSLDPFVVSSTTCALRTVMHAYERLGAVHEPQFEDTVVVLGSGSVGLYAVAVAKARGVKRVINVGTPADRLEIARSWGADDTFDIATTSAEERIERVRDATQGRGADVVIDCAGPSVAFEDSLKLVRDAGTVVEVGAAAQEMVSFKPWVFNMKMVTVTGNLSGGTRHYHRAIEFIERHGSTFDFGAILSEPRPLSEANEAIDAIHDQSEIKPTVAPRG